SDIGKGDAYILRLPARIAARQVRITEKAAHMVTVEGVRYVCLAGRVGIVAAGELLALAEEASAAGDHEGHDHPVALLQPCIALADFDHLAHELVAEYIARPHGRDDPVVKMQVGAANGR